MEVLVDGAIAQTILHPPQFSRLPKCHTTVSRKQPSPSPPPLASSYPVGRTRQRHVCGGGAAEKLKRNFLLSCDVDNDDDDVAVADDGADDDDGDGADVNCAHMERFDAFFSCCCSAASTWQVLATFLLSVPGVLSEGAGAGCCVFTLPGCCAFSASTNMWCRRGPWLQPET
jgi:hypothetical protein